MAQNKFEEWNNTDLATYYNWLTSKTSDNEEYSYSVCASVNPYESYDAIQLKTDAEGYIDFSFIELKGRNVSITDYSDCIVEQYKINNLIRIAESTGKNVYLVALYYPSKKLAIWKLDANTDYEVENKLCQWHTADGTGEMKNKTMAKLPLSDAKIFRF